MLPAGIGSALRHARSLLMDLAMNSLLSAGFGSGNSHRLLLALVALGLMLAEYLFHKVSHVESHDAGETAASLAIAVGNKIIGAFTAGLAAVPMLFAYQHRLF